MARPLSCPSNVVQLQRAIEQDSPWSPIREIRNSVDDPSPAQIDLYCYPDEVRVVLGAELGLQHGGRVGDGFVGDAEFGRDF